MVTGNGEGLKGGNGEWGMGNGEWGMGNGDCDYDASSRLPMPAVRLPRAACVRSLRPPGSPAGAGAGRARGPDPIIPPRPSHPVPSVGEAGGARRPRIERGQTRLIPADGGRTVEEARVQLPSTVYRLPSTVQNRLGREHTRQRRPWTVVGQRQRCSGPALPGRSSRRDREIDQHVVHEAGGDPRSVRPVGAFEHGQRTFLHLARRGRRAQERFDFGEQQPFPE